MSDEAKFQFYLNRQGVRGKKGEKGDTGFSPTIEVAVNTAAEYKLKVINEGDEFITDNLRGSAVDDMGGTYMRYDPETQKMYAGNANQASEETTGEVALADDSAMQQFDIYTAVTPKKLADNLSFYLKSSDNSVIISQDSEDSKTNLIADLTGVEADISGLDSRVTGLESSVSNIENTTIPAMQNDIADLQLDAANHVTLHTNQTISGVKKFNNGTLTVGNNNTSQTVANYDEVLHPLILDDTVSRIGGTVLGDSSSNYCTSLARGTMQLVNDNGVIKLANIFNEFNLTGGTNAAIVRNPQTGGYEIVAHDTTYTEGSGININTANEISVKVDGSTIDVNSDGELEVIGGGGGSSYTAGDGIDITNDEISVKVDPFSLTFNASNQLTTVGEMFNSYTRTILDPTSQEQYTFTDYKFPEAGTGTWTPSSGIIYNLKTRLRDGFNNIILTNDMITQANGIQFTPNGDNGEFTIGAKVDGITITTNSSGELQATPYTLPTASTTEKGGVKVDGTTITIDNNGVISSSGGSAPTNMVTTDTTQSITGDKTFSGSATFSATSDNLTFSHGFNCGSSVGIQYFKVTKGGSYGYEKTTLEVPANFVIQPNGTGSTYGSVIIGGCKGSGGTSAPYYHDFYNSSNPYSPIAHAGNLTSTGGTVTITQDGSKINLEASGGAQIDDTQASATTTYSSNMINTQITSATTVLANTVQSYYVQKSDIATTLSSSSTDSQVASAKCVYDMIGDIETLLSNI